MIRSVSLNLKKWNTADLCAEDNVSLIKNEIKDFYCDEGGVHPGKLWSLRKKLFPNYREPPVAMKDFDSNLITSMSEIEQLSIETYRNRLKKQTYYTRTRVAKI